MSWTSTSSLSVLCCCNLTWCANFHWWFMKFMAFDWVDLIKPQGVSCGTPCIKLCMWTIECTHGTTQPQQKQEKSASFYKKYVASPCHFWTPLILIFPNYCSPLRGRPFLQHGDTLCHKRCRTETPSSCRAFCHHHQPNLQKSAKGILHWQPWWFVSRDEHGWGEPPCPAPEKNNLVGNFCQYMLILNGKNTVNTKKPIYSWLYEIVGLLHTDLLSTLIFSSNLWWCVHNALIQSHLETLFHL